MRRLVCSAQVSSELAQNSQIAAWEEARKRSSFVQGWPACIKVDRVPCEQVGLLCVSSQDTLQLSLSPASFQSLRDALEFAETFVPAPADHGNAGEAESSRASQHLLQRPLSFQPRHLDSMVLNDSGESDRYACFNLFELCNRTGLGMACYVPGAEGARDDHMEMASCNVFKALTFRPLVESVHLPDFGRKVLPQVIILSHISIHLRIQRSATFHLISLPPLLCVSCSHTSTLQARALA
jgi:hypothetical protein